MNIRYISISGNTRSFVQRLTTYSEEQHQHNEKKSYDYFQRNFGKILR